MSEHSPEVLEALARVEALQDRIRQVSVAMLKAKNGALFPIDIVAVAALNRAQGLTASFGLLIERRFFVAAAALLRMQLDTALRFSALDYVADPSETARQIIKGKQIRKLKDRDGKALTDARLVELVGAGVSWIPTVYDKTSGFVHLSDAHIFSAVGPAKTTDPHTYSVKVGAEDEHVEDATYLEAIEAFLASTDLFLARIEAWTAQKDGHTEVAMGSATQRVTS